jgi:hypothetical protein
MMDAPSGQDVDTQSVPHEAAAPDRISSGALVLQLARYALLIGLSISLLLHAIGLLASSRVYYGIGSRGGDPTDERSSLALTRGPELADLIAGSIEVSSPASGDLSASPAQASVEQALDAMRDPSLESGADATVAGALSGAGDVGGVEGLSDGLGGGSGGGGGASFFGVEAQGSRFVFIVDVSGSMSVGGKIEALKTQLSRSVQNLVETSSFMVYTFSDDAAPLGNSKDWVSAIDERKRWARRAIGTMQAGGGTNPINAFRAAFKLRPRPDAVYFMTDGEFDPNVSEEVARLNTGRAPIHCIAFATRDSEAVMKRIATQSKGTYKFVPGVGP